MKVSVKNVKNITDRVFDLEKLNLLNGKNGSGKSSLMEAISIAINGHDISGHKMPGDIMNLSQEDMMSIMVNIPAVTIRREIKRTNKGGSTTIFIDGEKVNAGIGQERIASSVGKMIDKINLHDFVNMKGSDISKMLFEIFSESIVGNIDHFVLETKKKILSLDSTLGDTAMLDFGVRIENAKGNVAEIIEKTMEKIQTLRPHIHSAMNIIFKAMEKAVKGYDAISTSPAGSNQDSLYKYLKILLPIIESARSSLNKDKKRKIAYIQESIEELPAEEVPREVVEEEIKNLLSKKEKLNVEKTVVETENKSIRKQKSKIDEIKIALKDLKVVDIEKFKKQKFDLENKQKELSLPITEKEFEETNRKMDIVLGSITEIKGMKRNYEIAKIRNQIIEVKKDIASLATKDADREVEIVKERLLLRGANPLRFKQKRALDTTRAYWEKVITAIESGECPTCGTLTKNMRYDEEYARIEINNIALKQKNIDASQKEADNKMKALDDEQKAIDEKRIRCAEYQKKLDDLEKSRDKYDDLSKRLKDKQKTRDALAKKQKNIDLYKKVSNEKKSIASMISDIEMKIQQSLQSKAYYKEMEKMSDIAKEKSVDDIVDELSEISQSLRMAEKAKEACIKREASVESIDKLKLALTKTEAEYNIVKKAKDVFAESKKNLVEEPIKNAVVHANKIMSTMKPGTYVYLEPDGAGITVDGEGRGKDVLSDGEVIMFAISLITGLLISTDNKFKMLMLEGSELDDDNLKNVMRALLPVKELDAVLLATHNSHVKAIKGWNEVRFDKQ